MKNTSKILALLLCAVMMVGLFAGCGSSDSSTPVANTSDAPANREDEVNQQAFEAEKGEYGTKSITFGIQNYGGGGIDPVKETNTAWNCSRYGVGECLFMFNDALGVDDKLCDSYTVNDAHTEWVFHIREGVKFSDGCDLTPEAVKASFERLWAEGPNGSAAPQTFLETEAELVADNAAGTLTVKTVTAYPDLTQNLANPVMIILDVEHTTDYNHAAIGTGPYIATNFRDEVGYTMVANQNYWGGEVPFASIELQYMGDAQAKAYSMLADQLDLTENIVNVADLRNLQSDSRFTVSVAPGVRTGLCHMNMNEGRFLANKTLRQAVLMALDDDIMCNITLGGLYTPGAAAVPSNLDYGYENLVDPYPYDQDAAAQLLDDAGIVDSDGNGYRELDGQEIVLKYVTYDNRGLKDFAEAIQLQLKMIGIKVDLEIGDSNRQWDSFQTGDFDLNGSNWNTVAVGDPSEFLKYWYSESGVDYFGYKNEEYDALYAQLQSETNIQARKDIFQQLQQILLDDAAALIHGYYNSTMVSRNDTIGGAAIHTVDYYWVTTELYPAA